MSTTLPEKIDRYRVLRAIARGGMAEVYEVEDPASGDHIALKLLLNTESELERFNREYEMMNCLNHPNVVRVYHYGLVGDLPWITMELIEGTPVQSYVKSLGKAGSQRRTTLGWFRQFIISYSRLKRSSSLSVFSSSLRAMWSPEAGSSTSYTSAIPPRAMARRTR